MDDMTIEKLDTIRKDMISAVYTVLEDHAGGSWQELKNKPEYIQLFNYACSGIDSGYKEIYLKCQERDV